MKTVTYSICLQLTALLVGAFTILSCRGQSYDMEDNIISTAYIPNCSVSCGFMDSKGMLWFGSNQGVYRYDGSSFISYSEMDGISSNRVSTITQDQDGNIWFGTSDGLCSYDGKKFIQIPIPWSDTSGIWLDEVYPIVNPNQVMCMLQDKNGLLWIGTNGAGAYSYDGKTFTSFLSKEGRKQTDGLHHNIINSVLEDLEGNIWFTSMTHGGVSRYDGESFAHFMPKDGLSDDMVRSSFLDKAGNIWFGTNGNRKGGLDYFDGKTFTNFNETNGLCLYENDGRCYNGVRCIYEDQAGNVWLGNSFGRLCLYDGSSFKQFSTKDGQTIMNVLFALEDRKRNMWFGTRNGHMYRYDGENVKDFMKR